MNSFFFFKALYQFPNDLASKQFASKAEDTRDAGLIPGWGRYPGESIPVFLPENPMDRRNWWATVQRDAKSWTQLSD